jgi:hypothetical protein
LQHSRIAVERNNIVIADCGDGHGFFLFADFPEWLKITKTAYRHHSREHVLISFPPAW